MVWYTGCEPWMLSILVFPALLISDSGLGALRGSSLPGKGLSPFRSDGQKGQGEYTIFWLKNKAGGRGPISPEAQGLEGGTAFPAPTQ
jgi:hypothetical protein